MDTAALYGARIYFIYEKQIKYNNCGTSVKWVLSLGYELAALY